MEEEIRAEVRARRRRSIQVMAQWLEQQELANSEEGTPRELVVEAEDPMGGAKDEAVIVEPAGTGHPVLDSGEGGVEDHLVEPGQRLLSEFFRSRK